MDEPINLVLFSGTDDKLQAAAVLTAGAAALGKPVNIFLQYWALDAFRADRIGAEDGLAPEAGSAGRTAIADLTAADQVSSADTLRLAKELGGMATQVCSLSIKLLKLESGDLDPPVDGVQGVTSCYLNAGQGQLVFIAPAVRAIPSGAAVELVATDPGSIEDIAAWGRAAGNGLVEQIGCVIGPPCRRCVKSTRSR